jgi:hypothetical protein
VTESAKSKRELPSEDYGNHSEPRVLACSSQHRRPYMLVCPAQSLSRTGVISIPRRPIPHRDRASTKVPMSADPKRVLGETRASDRITRTNAWNVGPNSPTQLDQSTPHSEVAPSILAPRFQTLLAHACIRLQQIDPHCPRTRLRMDVAVTLLDQRKAETATCCEQHRTGTSGPARRSHLCQICQSVNSSTHPRGTVRVVGISPVDQPDL